MYMKTTHWRTFEAATSVPKESIFLYHAQI
jgi:hypothetical protein